MTYRAIATLVSLAVLCACGNSQTSPTIVPPPTPAANTLFVFSPDRDAELATYPASAKGSSTPSSVLDGSKTLFDGLKKDSIFGGGISIEVDGTIYVLDAMRARVLTFAPASRGNTAPLLVERLPQNDGVSLHVPQYAGFALDNNGGFWTVDRSNGNIDRFPLGVGGRVKATTTFKPSVLEGHQFVPGVASTVASDGMGNIYCICQPDDLVLQLYCITKYDVTGSKPKLVSSIYGILGNLDTQIPSTVMHVDPRTKIVYVGIWTPTAVLEYPADAPSGQARMTKYISGPRTTLDTVPAAITTDATGAVYVAQREGILVFGPSASGNVKPTRTISDPNHLHFLGDAYGDLLAIQ
ncbi:MAG TPA: hypothetical protein VGG89_07660 [Candidatus Baltobacteraceae bacterium]|jgi:hypothetical protein